MGFLDRGLDIVQRASPLDDALIADSVVIHFLSTIPASFRLEALTLCWRAAAHERWAASQVVEDREAIASNLDISCELQMRLARDLEPSVRAALAGNHRLDLEVVAVPLADPSVIVQEALARHFECRREAEPIDEWDDLPVSADSLSYLIEMVPAVEAEECLEDWEKFKHDR